MPKSRIVALEVPTFEVGPIARYYATLVSRYVMVLSYCGEVALS